MRLKRSRGRFCGGEGGCSRERGGTGLPEEGCCLRAVQLLLAAGAAAPRGEAVRVLALSPRSERGRAGSGGPVFVSLGFPAANPREPGDLPCAEAGPARPGGRRGSERAHRPSFGSLQRKKNKRAQRYIWQGNCSATCSSHALCRSSASCADRAFTWELVGELAGASCNT